MLALGAYFGGHCARNEKNILVYLCSRPAQGGGAGLVTTKIKLRHYLYYCLPLEKLKKYFGVPEAQKIFWCTCALDPPWGGSGGSGTVTTKIKVCQNPHYLWGFWHSYHQNKSVPEPPLPILLGPMHISSLHL